MPVLEGYASHSMFAVFDGHGGSLMAQQAPVHIATRITSVEQFMKDPINPVVIGKAICGMLPRSVWLAMATPCVVSGSILALWLGVLLYVDRASCVLCLTC